MKQNFFKIEKNLLKVLHLETIRIGLYQFAGIFIIAGFFPLVLGIIVDISVKRSILKWFQEFFTDPIYLVFGIIIPAAAIIFAQHFPPAPKVNFYSDNQNVTWQCGPSRLEIPFEKIVFSTMRMPSTRGISNVFVMITAFDKKPFFMNEQQTIDAGGLYKKDLCLYKAGTQEDADESIAIINSFMAGTYDDSPSKFDEL